MTKRRSIGPAFERSPLEKVTDWAYRNVLFLISTIVTVFIWLLLVNWVFDHMLPVATGDGSGTQEIVESSNGPGAIAVKLVGTLLIILLFHKQSTKR